MGIVVQKFGGSSVADTEKLFLVCDKIIEEYNSGNKVVVVVSAQGKTTDSLIKEANEINKHNFNKREIDVLLSIGEQKSASKICMCLNKRGYNAVSLMGWQIPILTDEVFGNARIQSIGDKRILQEFEKNNIVVVAGFQGIDKNNNITTLRKRGVRYNCSCNCSFTQGNTLRYIYRCRRCVFFRP